VHGESLTLDRVSRIISDIGEKAGVVVHTAPKSGKVKYASAHDFRRAFGDRWACLVTSAVLMSLMRHKSIDTTMKYYVGRSVQATAELVWDAYSRKVADLPPTDQRDTSRDTPRETDGEKLP
jgi:integrase